jgi:hypothetical protein
MEIFPTTAGTDIITSALSVVTANIGVVVTLLGFGLGVGLWRRFMPKGGKARV